MNIKEFCNFLNISEPTIYNWRADKPNLYKIVMEYKKEKIDNTDNLSEMLKYFNKLSEKEGLTPCYSYNGTTDVSKWKLDSKKIGKMKFEKEEAFLKAFDSAMVCNFDASGYRLPTRYEWEYAAGRYELHADNIDDFAWYHDNSDYHSHEVATKKSNEYGLYDMYGNVKEWCWNNKKDGNSRFMYGGDYSSDKRELITDDSSRPYNDFYRFGLRLVRTVE